MSKPKYPASLKINIAKAYLENEISYGKLALKHNVDKKTVRNWIALYKAHGESAFSIKTNNTTYTSEFKVKCVKMVLSGEKTINETAIEYNISSDSVLRKWIKSYNVNKTLKNYNLKKEVCMTKTRRKTTLEERMNAVKYCILNNYNYRETANIFGVSYNQVYSWVKKYETKKENGLIDNRGRHKSDEEVDELEQLRRENKRLKSKLKENDMLVQLLKKVNEFERM